MRSRLSQHAYALLLFAIICLAYLFVTFHRVSPAVMANDIMAETGLTATTMGLLASVFFVIFGLMQLPSGILADTLGPRKTLPAFLALAGLGSVLFAHAQTLPMLVGGRALAGFGVSVVFVCGVKLITTWFPVAVFARMNGLLLGMGGVGLVLGSGPLAYLCEFVGWRQAILLCGIATLGIGALLLALVRNTPADAGYGMPDPPPAASAGGKQPGQAAVVREIFTSRGFWLVSLWFSGQFAVHMAFGGLWGGTFLTEVRGMSRTEAGNILNMMGLGMLLGAPFNGWLSDVVFRARKPVMLLSSLATMGLFLVLSAWGRAMPVPFLYLWFFLLAAFGMGALSAGFAAMRHMFGARATGTASGFLNSFPSFVVALLQTLNGRILEAYPRTEQGFSPEAYSAACFLYVGMAAVGFLGAFASGEKRT